MAEGKVADGWYQFDNDLNSVIDGLAGNGVVSGLAGVEDSPAAMIVEIAAGTYVANETEVVKAAATDVTIEAADGSNPRKDIIIADSSGNITVVKGTAAAAVPSGQTGPNTSTPVPGNITANKIILAEVWVGTGVTTILDANITDRRVLIRKQVVFIASGALAETGQNAKVFAWRNTVVSADILVHKVLIDITTASTAAAKINVGVNAADAADDDLIDGAALNATGILNNIDNKGTNGAAARRCNDDEYVTGYEDNSADPDGLVGKYYIFYSLV